MKVVAISGAIIGKKTLTTMKYVAEKMNKDFPEVEFDLIDLGKKDIQFSDGRNYTEYQGDTLEVTTKDYGGRCPNNWNTDFPSFNSWISEKYF